MSVPKPVFGSGAFVSAKSTCLRSGLSDGRAGAAVGGRSTTRPRIFALASRQSRPAGFARMNVALAHAPDADGKGVPLELQDASTTMGPNRTVARFTR